jgi:hypothetical protein
VPPSEVLGSERRFGRKVVVEAAVGEAPTAFIKSATASEAMLTTQAVGCLDDALAIICGPLFGRFHCAISRKLNSSLDIIMIIVIVLYNSMRSFVIIVLRFPGDRWAKFVGVRCTGKH